MLSVSIDEYTIPSKFVDNNDPVWRMKSQKGDDTLYARTFNYTFFTRPLTENYSEGKAPGRMTFTYNGSSVKATPRTLRIYGAKCISSITSVLCSWDYEKRDKSGPYLVQTCHRFGFNLTMGK